MNLCLQTLVNSHAPVSNLLAENLLSKLTPKEHKKRERQKGSRFTKLTALLHTVLPLIISGVVEVQQERDFNERKMGANTKSFKKCF